MKRSITTFLLLLLVTTAWAQRAISGRVYDKQTGEGIPFATIYLTDTEKGCAADIKGRYQLTTTQKGSIRCKVSSLGYTTRELTIGSQQTVVDISLQQQSVALDEFTVTAKYHDKLGSNATIDQEALEYIQPTSLQDVFTLIPGGKMGSNNMQGRGLISSRQAGTDEATSFGMGISIDGIPMQNDGNRIQLTGFTGVGPTDQEGNVAVNTGVDLRTLSTDHIESVEIGRGIASAKEGNLSSGSIRIIPKQGKSPLRARVKFDPLNKLAYVGKGFLLSERLGTLYLGADIVRSTSSIEDTRGAYNRLTVQANWSNQRRWWGKTVDMSLRGSYVTSFNNNKSDDIIENYQEDYKTRYQRLTLSGKLTARLGTLLVDELELMGSLDYTSDRLEHNKQVINRSVTPIQMSTVEGESEGEYLPAMYRTYYEIDNRPLNLFGQLTASKFGNITDQLNFSAILGTTLNYTKNVGDGVVSDPLRPPFTDKSYIRPRKNSDIPALAHHAGYAELKLRYKQGASEVNSQFGIRETIMLNLPSDYALRGKMLWEPRLQLSYTLTTGEFRNTLRAGYGVENKLPSADFLYPDKIYSDFIMLNAYFTDPSKRYLLTWTRIQDPTNPQLRENKNKKWELGWDLHFRQYALSLTIFREEMKGGAEYFTQYEPFQYTYYYELKHPVDTKPTKDDFLSKTNHEFAAIRKPMNSSRVVKKGLEYRIHIPRIEPIRTQIEINGAYYSTMYTNGIPVMYAPPQMAGGESFPYMGIFSNSEKTYRKSFNTNFWLHTHLPKLKLIFTNFIQVVWFERARIGREASDYPEHYMDKQGDIWPLTEEAMAADPTLQSLHRQYADSRYNELRKPISLRMNLKLTKEFSDWVKFSFFADNILQISPKYKNNYEQTVRDWHRPFFGAELTINIH